MLIHTRISLVLLKDGSPLHMAAVRGRMEAAQFLLDRYESQRDRATNTPFSVFRSKY